MPTIEYSCADGTPFPVTFATNEDAELSWRLEQEHFIGPASPLAEGIDRLGRPGAEKAYAEAGLPVPSMWRTGPDANGFAYMIDAFPGPEDWRPPLPAVRAWSRSTAAPSASGGISASRASGARARGFASPTSMFR